MIQVFENIDYDLDPALFDGYVNIDPDEVFIDPISNALITPLEDWPMDPISNDLFAPFDDWDNGPFLSPPDTDQSCDTDDMRKKFSRGIPLNKSEWSVRLPNSQRSRAPRLLEFLILLLSKSHYESYASFVNRSKGLFQIHEPEKVAKLWEAVKSRQSGQRMTYDKFARGVRWLYKSNKMQKTNTRYTFQFSPKTFERYFVDENNNISMKARA